MLALKIYFPTLRVPIAESLMFPNYVESLESSVSSWPCTCAAYKRRHHQDVAKFGPAIPGGVWNFPWRDLLQVTIAQRTKNPQYLNPQANQLCTIFNQNVSFKSDKAEHIQTSVVNRKPMWFSEA